MRHELEWKRRATKSLCRFSIGEDRFSVAVTPRPANIPGWMAWYRHYGPLMGSCHADTFGGPRFATREEAEVYAEDWMRGGILGEGDLWEYIPENYRLRYPGGYSSPAYMEAVSQLELVFIDGGELREPPLPPWLMAADECPCDAPDASQK